MQGERGEGREKGERGRGRERGGREGVRKESV